MALLRIARPTAGKALSVLDSMGVVQENTGKRRDRIFGYAAYLKKLTIGTELP